MKELKATGADKANPVFDPKCEQCKKARKSRKDRIEDLMLYANQLYKLGLREYITFIKKRR